MAEGDSARCYEAALRFLEFRQRSEGELRQYLVFRKKFLSEDVNGVIGRLKKLGLVDDYVFAEAWAQERSTFRNKSRSMIRHELQLKGIDPEIISQVTASIDDAENAFKAGMKKVRHMGPADYAEFYKRLSSYLLRQGYGGGAVNSAVQRVWDMINSNC
jgi:SOS response regulatory protein OraA/RecX